jgi:hypothetical protein
MEATGEDGEPLYVPSASKLQELFTMVIAGLAGTTPHMMSATVLGK